MRQRTGTPAGKEAGAEKKPNAEGDTVNHASAVTDGEQSGKPVSPAAAAAAPPERRNPVFPLLLGGVLAAGLGAAVVLYLLPEGWRAGDPALEERVAALEAQPAPPSAEAIAALIEDQLAPVQARLDTLEAGDEAAGTALGERLDALTERLEAAEAIDLDAIDTRLQSLASRIEAAEEDAPGPDLGPLESRIAALESGREAEIEEAARAAVSAAFEDERAAQQARADELDETAAALASEQERLSARMALNELSLAAESGAPAPDALDRVAAVTEPPAPLGAFAEGLPTLAELQADFPEAARRALAAAPVREDAPFGARVTSFLRSQAGARSLAPRPGGDPDAVLSRAEAEVRAGRLRDALDELDALPPEAADELADWHARAERRVAALDSLAEMQARLGSE